MKNLVKVEPDDQFRITIPLEVVIPTMSQRRFNLTQIVPINRKPKPRFTSVYVNHTHYAVFPSWASAREAIEHWRRCWPAAEGAVFSIACLPTTKGTNHVY